MQNTFSLKNHFQNSASYINLLLASEKDMTFLKLHLHVGLCSRYMNAERAAPPVQAPWLT